MKNKFKKSNQLFKKVKEMIPLASQTFSKSYLIYVKGFAPLFLTHGQGSRVWDVDGHQYIDFVNGLLPIVLGYQYPAVDEAIKRQLKKGITFSMASVLEYELARLLIKHIPCAEMVRFGKNGSDVTAGAVRIARAVTGREHVAVCGYHGWQDWYIGSTTRNLGVPKSTQVLTHRFNYNDLNSLKKIFKNYPRKVAAVILEPMNFEEPKDNFLRKVKELTHKNGALLIFDEVVTGFRFHLGGAQKLFGVTPDLACFGKAMANGMPISALVGKKIYMKKVTDIFFSFTNGGEALSIAAAIATIKELESKKVLDYLWRLGAYLSEKTNLLIIKNNLQEVLTLAGKPCWSVFIFKKTKKYSVEEIESYLQQELIQAGFLWHGQHNLSFSHTKSEIDKLIAVYGKIFPKLRQLIDSGKLRNNLKGKPISHIFKVR
ncbi:MAG: aminotransferase class III [Candidatus Buchananbacteria bacterium RIFCSPHIGHO2_01_FULL_39_14]|uniref:Aminotransferase class III n=1 Tax=Candidatus Buchananbacteria bacterium RIFCSPHIGHO2_01_FULL_39_14 TaxID=1797532 RepID=A0A1G1XXW8_9BACT|nr:MAG: aminotransferase class III [Candidatus Buchananbacteria bacterium RIFCSPHIGHO2_01_FULL_39_14]OGY48660.1 MAG: aminotransferase class III [Candidatus Buchananbacteria bacterium RIFCSPHIGHO2_02_FULL_39_17]